MQCTLQVITLLTNKQADQSELLFVLVASLKPSRALAELEQTEEATTQERTVITINLPDIKTDQWLRY